MTRDPGHPSGGHRRQPRWRDRWPEAAAGGILVLAVWLDFTAGRRGLFPLDQSIIFDGAHRILAGQVPFQDFVLPFGPIAPVLQALLLALLGTDWEGFLLSASLANAVATGLGMLLLRLVLPDRPILWLLGGLLTAIWFYPPSGTPWFDQYAFLFVLAGALLLTSVTLDDRRSRLAIPAAGLAGACWALALLTKQNAGIASLPLFFLLLAVPLLGSGDATAALSGSTLSPRRTALAWGSGAILVLVGFTVWLALAADPSLFLRHAIEIPGGEGIRRLRGSPLDLLAVHSTGTGSAESRIVVLASGLVALAVAGREVLRARTRGSGSDLRLVTAGVLGAGLFLTQHLFAATSHNQPQISASFSGLLPPLAAGALLRLEARAGEPSIHRRAILATVLGGGLVLAVAGLRVSFDRVAHDLFSSDTAFDRPLDVRNLEVVRWGRPTVLEGPHTRGRAVVRALEVERLARALSRRPGPFFVFPDWSLLYGILGRPAPQPLLWFHEGLTYPRAASGTAPDGGTPLDRWVVADLERNRVQTIVLEQISWLGTEARLSDFPELIDLLHRCFEETERIGIFQLYVRRPGCRGSGAPRHRSPSGSPHRGDAESGGTT